MSRTGMVCQDMTLAILKDLCGSRDDLLFPELDEPLALDETRAGRLAEDHHRHAPVERQAANLEDARQLVLGHLVVGKAVEGGENAAHHALHGDVGLGLAVWKVESVG